MTATARRERGQATVELALGSLVIITVLTVGVHLAETVYLELKMTEAASAAIWDTTAREMHRLPGGSRAAQAVTASQADVEQRYVDFDGRQSTASGTTLTQMFTQAQNFNLACRSGGAPGFDPGYHTSGAYAANGGISCTAGAVLQSIRVPGQFYDDSFFAEPHHQSVPFQVCAVGRAWGGGNCTGQFTSMLDDWGLSGRRESGVCPLIPNVPAPCPTNMPYWQSAFSVFTRNGMGMGVAGSSLAMHTIRRMPLPFFFGGENMFWMSHMGEFPSLFHQPLPSEGQRIWTVTPGGAMGVQLPAGGLYTISYGIRTASGGCFLGKGGC